MIRKGFTLVAFLTAASFPFSAGYAAPFMTDEASSAEIAADLGPYLDFESRINPEAVEDPGDRLILPSEFGKYGIVVDVFRQSSKRPVLGRFDPSYVDAAAPKRLAKARFSALANSEFLVVSVDGKPIKANLVSGALESEIDQVVKKNGFIQYDSTGAVVTEKSKKMTPNGNFMLTVLMGKDGTRSVPYPFRTSSTYDRSAMFWGLHIFGGYLIHSTPHTYQLGRPASMGCVRQSFPDAMELWDLLANHAEGRLAMVRIHKMHSLEAYTRLREIVYDPLYSSIDPVYKLTPEDSARSALPNADRDLKWLIGELNRNYQNLHDYMAKYGREHMGTGFAWIDPKTKKAPAPVYPKCGNDDCFEVWGDPIKKQKADQKADAEKNAKARALLKFTPPVDDSKSGYP